MPPSMTIRIGSIFEDRVLSSYSTSLWYMRPISSSISPSEPDSSPTMIICSTTGVKMPVRWLVDSRLSPRSTPLRMSCRALAT